MVPTQVWRVIRVLRGVEPFVVPFAITTTVSITDGQVPRRNIHRHNTKKDKLKPIPFPFTVNQNATAVLSLSIDSPSNSNIDNDYDVDNDTGYGGFVLAAGDDLTVESGICGRTMAVQTAILGQIAATDDCMMVTIAQLQAIGRRHST